MTSSTNRIFLESQEWKGKKKNVHFVLEDFIALFSSTQHVKLTQHLCEQFKKVSAIFSALKECLQAFQNWTIITSTEWL